MPMDIEAIRKAVRKLASLLEADEVDTVGVETQLVELARWAPDRGSAAFVTVETVLDRLQRDSIALGLVLMCAAAAESLRRCLDEVLEEAGMADPDPYDAAPPDPARVFGVVGALLPKFVGIYNNLDPNDIRVLTSRLRVLRHVLRRG